MNFVVYASLFIYYIAYLLNFSAVGFLERFAEVALALSALTIVAGFILYAALIYNHFQKLQLSVDKAFGFRLKKLNKSIKFHRLFVVYLTCIISFSTRAFFLLCDWHMSGWNVLTFFLVLEILPTGAMLYVFWPLSSKKEIGAEEKDMETERLLPKQEMEVV